MEWAWAYRDIQEYNYKHYLERKDYRTEPKYYYVSCFGRSILYSSMYAIPILLPITAGMELYNLEDYIRGRKNDDE